MTSLKKFLVVLGVASSVFPCAVRASEEWPLQVEERFYKSSTDGSIQPALFFSPETDEKRPLLVALHTWSGDYRQKLSIPYAEWAIQKGWVFIHPNFRGPNKRPEATGSEVSTRDVVDAVEYAEGCALVDESRIYLIGTSGGGMAALLAASRYPDVWAGVSSWVPVTDLAGWYVHCKEKGLRYTADIVASVGGIPTKDPKAAEQCRKRSVLTYLANAGNVPIDLNVGIHDGHTGSIPVDQSLRAFNILAKEEDRFTAQQIRFIVENEKIPEEIKDERVSDPLYGDKKVLLRRKSNNIRLTIFDGGHEIVYSAGLTWLSRQRKAEKR